MLICFGLKVYNDLLSAIFSNGGLFLDKSFTIIVLRFSFFTGMLSVP